MKKINAVPTKKKKSKKSWSNAQTDTSEVVLRILRTILQFVYRISTDQNGYSNKCIAY